MTTHGFIGRAMLGALLFQAALPLVFALPGGGVCAEAQIHSQQQAESDHAGHMSHTSEQLATCLCALMEVGRLADSNASSDAPMIVKSDWHIVAGTALSHVQPDTIAASYHWASRAPPIVS